MYLEEQGFVSTELPRIEIRCVYLILSIHQTSVVGCTNTFGLNDVCSQSTTIVVTTLLPCSSSNSMEIRQTQDLS